MRHYEIIFMVHPDQSEKIPLLIEKYKNIINDNGGMVHRLEDWGRRQLSYSINKLHKAHYILMNIEVFPKTITLLETEFRFNNIILRNLIMSMKKAVIELSPILKLKDDKKEKK
ncbi:30S ribosomal protein S6 [Buchnera aphidicola str. Ak (Acyrthosiphon kondoi)]|jgi:small subunit ribosomal protein S6|uniref:Small ribosomal subunit protein bS6 n=1 Tax=Buchnera aphidicola str. Ak (Acyrthosiphon kondoi) TaxID=1005090 RepID=G2LM47_9GAMM|nr:30S ribosomal protein S6 [Buchnera aphidicola]AEO08894.1 30S ribosomal protein S6 [Buchnera aphidicola str. Ak (Acyrthosiphon kondoi)]WAI18305.1 MAG: 30S ribosomal protein S6 [Buchnera aphidicola (Acyrthosiphon caraganae)]